MKREVQKLCRKLWPGLGRKIDRFWSAYLAESDAAGREDKVATGDVQAELRTKPECEALECELGHWAAP